MKICPTCVVQKQESDFSRCSRRADGLQYQCKACESKAHADKYREEIVVSVPTEKKCTSCDTVKPASDFHKHNKRSDGLQQECKKCKAEKQAKAYKEPSGELLKYHRDYYAGNKQYHVDYYNENSSEILPKLRYIRTENPWIYLIISARSRAKKGNIPYDIDLDWGQKTYTGRCELTGLKFEVSKGDLGTTSTQFSPSIDRIKPELGYTKGNCRWICWGINALKGSGDDAGMMKLAISLVSAYSAEQFRLQQEKSSG